MSTQTNQALTVIATIKVKSENVEQVKPEIIKLTKASQAEQGAIQYHVHQDNENSSHFITYEVWESSEFLEQHNKSAHFTSFVEATDGMIDNIVIYKTTLIV